MNALVGRIVCWKFGIGNSVSPPPHALFVSADGCKIGGVSGVAFRNFAPSYGFFPSMGRGLLRTSRVYSVRDLLVGHVPWHKSVYLAI